MKVHKWDSLSTSSTPMLMLHLGVFCCLCTGVVHVPSSSDNCLMYMCTIRFCRYCSFKWSQTTNSAEKGKQTLAISLLILLNMGLLVVDRILCTRVGLHVNLCTYCIYIHVQVAIHNYSAVPKVCSL